MERYQQSWGTVADDGGPGRDGALGRVPPPLPTASGGLPWARLRRVTEHIQDNLGRDLRLAELSELVHMSPYHFARLFKRSTGVSPHRFLLRRRIDRAMALLAAPGCSIAEVTGAVGFRTASHFTTVFRRITGITPGAYRAKGARTDRPGADGGLNAAD